MLEVKLYIGFITLNTSELNRYLYRLTYCTAGSEISKRKKKCFWKYLNVRLEF